MQKIYDVCVVGLGYIGLPTAIMFAKAGLQVLGVDTNPSVVSTVKMSKLHINEPGLERPLRDVVSTNNLQVSQQIRMASVYIIAVPTPFDHALCKPDMSHVEAACANVAPLLKKNDLVIFESTSPVGTTERLAKFFAEKRTDLKIPDMIDQQTDIAIAYCPERVLPGNIMQELVENDRIIGGMTKSCSNSAVQLYSAFVAGECRVATSPRVAEMTKLAENAFRDVNIAFANEMSVVGDSLNVDALEVIQLANFHPRVNILEPGPGVGGHCIAVDPWFLVNSEPDNTMLLKAARAVNDSKPTWVCNKIKNAANELKLNSGLPQDSVIDVALYGLTFKKNTSDLRESPAVKICKMLNHAQSYRLVVVEPNVSCLATDLAPAELVTYDQASFSQIHVLLVDHDAFKAHKAPNGVKIDTRGFWL